MRSLFIQIITLLAAVQLAAQTSKNVWTATTPATQSSENQKLPKKFKTYQLDFEALKMQAAAAPMEFSEAARSSKIEVELPTADGGWQQFSLQNSPLMHPDLASRYPSIQTFSGLAADGAVARLGFSPKGFHAFIFSPDGEVQSIRPLLDPAAVATGDEQYLVYHLDDLEKLQWGKHIACGNEDEPLPTDFFKNLGKNKADERGGAAEVILKKYRFAASAQSEYSAFHGNTKASVLAAIVEAMNFFTPIQERDFAVRLELIPNTDTLFWFDAASDPFFGQFISSWKDQNPAAVNARIGLNSYDFGHLFTRILNPPGGVYVAGQAVLSCICTVQKAQAGSSLPQPTGEDFYMVVTHEMGHQLSATHTFNSCPPSADNRTGSTAFEPGSGSTIMSYAGTCTPDDVQNKSDAYFHVSSVEQARNFIANEAGKNCGTNVQTGNFHPTVSIPLADNFFIPISTPFVLNGSATDPDGDVLAFCWEQFDLGNEIPLGNQTVTSPLFRSFPPRAQSERTFPRIQTIILNQTSKTEVLPTSSRNLTFKLSVRDNKQVGGGFDSKQIVFKSSDKAGPFLVTFPNATGVEVISGDFVEVTWAVANTDQPPVNCQKVNIKLSTDGGTNYPITLAAGVANNGVACIQIPENLTSTTARIRVEAADNIFFDISNSNFRIVAPTSPNFGFCAGDLKTNICTPQTFSTTVSTSALAGFSTAIDLKINNLPAGATAKFDPSTVQPGQSSVLKIEFPAAVEEGDFAIEMVGTAASSTRSRTLNFHVVNNDFSTFALQTPADGATGVSQSPEFNFVGAADANFYDFQLSASPTFDPILASLNDLLPAVFKPTTVLEKGKVYFWRMRPRNECGDGAWSDPFSFVTLKESCQTFATTELPKNLSANGTPTVEAKVNVPTGGAVSDVNVKSLKGSHQSFRQLDVSLISPAGTEVVLFRNRCGSISSTFNLGIDDAAATFPCPPTSSPTQPSRPTGVLANFNGQDAKGDWVLRAKDTEAGSGGTLEIFTLELCAASVLNPPFIVNNKVLTLPTGTNALIPNDLLKTEDSNNSAAQLTYTIVRAPKFGAIRINGVDQVAGSQFTQADLDGGKLRHFDYGQVSKDDFKFVVTDGEGGMVAGVFQIQASGVSANEAENLLAFRCFPNPSSGRATVEFGQNLLAETRLRLTNLAGQTVAEWQISAGERMANLEFGGVSSGVYFLSAENAAGRVVRKLVVR